MQPSFRKSAQRIKNCDAGEGLIHIKWLPVRALVPNLSASSAAPRSPAIVSRSLDQKITPLSRASVSPGKKTSRSRADLVTPEFILGLQQEHPIHSLKKLILTRPGKYNSLHNILA